MPANNKLFTPEQEAWFRENYYGKSHKEMAELLEEKFGMKVKPDNVKAWCSRHGLKNGRDGKWKNGVPALNKGKPAIFHSQEAKDNSAKTQFKPGSQPKNTDPIGTKKVLSDGYVWVKFNDKRKPKKKKENWCQEHILVWEAANGPIPDGHVIIHINQVKTDNRLENLLCVKRQIISHMTKKGLWSTDPEILKTNMLMAELSAKIYDRQGRSYKRVPVDKRKTPGNKKGSNGHSQG